MTAPLFILSFRQRDELNRIAEAAGWQPTAARRAANAEARFVSSGAAVALVDARGAAAEGLAAVRSLGDVVEANSGALLVLLSRNDEGLLGELHELGATHFLVSPFSEAQLHHAIHYAARHAARAGGGVTFRALRVAVEAKVSWRWQPGSREVQLDAGLARRAGLENGADRISLRRALALIGDDGRAAARVAVARLQATGEGTAFAHADPDQPAARLAHHVQLGPNGIILGRAEAIAGAAQPGASRDPLTGVGDGRGARAWLAERLSAAPADEGAAVVLLVALTRFDAINQAFGRASGDAVLQAAARRIARQADGDSDGRFVARLAGAEFAVFLAAPAGAADARLLAAHLMDAMARPFVSGDHAITIGSRIGIAVSRPHDTAPTLLRRASAALAEAKGQEGAPIRLIDADVERASARGDRLEIDLRRALDAGEIDVLFQPQVAIATGAIVGVEALARWKHPVHGGLGAATLFSVAERSDYLVQLSDHIQRKSILAVALWPAALSHLKMSVNITAQDIVRPGFAAQLLSIVRGSGVDPGRITVEVTESGLIQDLPAAAALLSELRLGGLKIAIDDFGTGYSSLAYLKALPLDYLKLDKRLCEDITGSPRDQVVVRSVIDMARSLGLAVVAEGVETREQLTLLAQEGCEIFQGFLCAPPLTIPQLTALILDEENRAKAGAAA
jgi:diguanylate cyclase (GGDEF)-like protein